MSAGDRGQIRKSGRCTQVDLADLACFQAFLRHSPCSGVEFERIRYDQDCDRHSGDYLRRGGRRRDVSGAPERCVAMTAAESIQATTGTPASARGRVGGSHRTRAPRPCRACRNRSRPEAGPAQPPPAPRAAAPSSGVCTAGARAAGTAPPVVVARARGLPSRLSRLPSPTTRPRVQWNLLRRSFEELVVAADSVIGLQLESPVSSDRAQVEDSVVARVTRDVRVGDRVAIPAGAKAYR